MPQALPCQGRRRLPAIHRAQYGAVSISDVNCQSLSPCLCDIENNLKLATLIRMIFKMPKLIKMESAIMFERNEFLLKLLYSIK